MHAVGIVAAAGSGSRLGARRPKALVPLGGRAMVCWAVDALRDAGVPDVVVAVPQQEQSAFATVLPLDVRLVGGGDSRTASVRAALAAAGQGTDLALVHDAARPLTPPEMIRRVFDALEGGARAVVPVLPMVDTTVLVDRDGVIADAVPREQLRRVQTPQGFHLPTLAEAYAMLADAANFTDDAAVVRAAGVPVNTVRGDELAAKVTVPHDLELAELLVGR